MKDRKPSLVAYMERPRILTAEQLCVLIDPYLEGSEVGPHEAYDYGFQSLVRFGEFILHIRSLPAEHKSVLQWMSMFVFDHDAWKQWHRFRYSLTIVCHTGSDVHCYKLMTVLERAINEDRTLALLMR